MEAWSANIYAHQLVPSVPFTSIILIFGVEGWTTVVVGSVSPGAHWIVAYLVENNTHTSLAHPACKIGSHW